MNTSTQKPILNKWLGLAAKITAIILIVTLSLGSPARSFPAQATDGILRDDFDGPDLNAWWWQGEDPPRFSFADNGEEHYLRMGLAGADPDHPRNLLMRSIPDGDFSITTRVLFEPTSNYQAAGLMLYQDDQNYLSVVRAFCDTPGDCVGNGIYFDAVIGGEWGGNFATSVENPAEAYFRLDRIGTAVTAFYRESSEESWIEIGTHTLPDGFVFNGAGLIAGQDFFTDEEYFADFDFLTISPASGEPWNDDFNGPTLGTWWWTGAEPTIVSIDGGSFLQMPASQVASPRNMLLRDAAPGDFTIQTRLLFAPNTNFQFAGLIIYQDDGNFLQFGRAYCDVEGACAGNGIYFDSVQGGGSADGNFATPIDSGDVYLRMERRGNMVRAFYSLDGGTSWYIAGDHWIPDDFQVNGVGLIASQDFSAIGIAADFDFFQLSEGFDFLPEGYHDYDQGDVPSWACNAGGWAVDPDDRGAPVQVEIVVDNSTVTTLPADQFRQDLLDAGLCTDGNCGFHTPLWGSISSYTPHTVATWAQDLGTGQWVLLYNSNKPLTCRTYDIYAYDPLTGQTTQISNLQDTDEFNPSWSPNGKKVAHDVLYTDGSYEVYVTDVATMTSAPLAGAGPGSNDAVWSPNGKWIGFDDQTATLFMVPATGGDRILLRENAVSMDWAPSGKRIVFRDTNDGSIRTIPIPGGKGAETIIVASGYNPSWSPDGNWIAYDIDGDIWKIAVNIQGLVLGEPIKLTGQPLGDGQPTWSADSQNIIFHSGQTQDYDLMTIPAVGGMPTWLTGAPNFGDYDPENANESPSVAYASFSPNGQAARQWASDYTADLAPGFWSEMTHTYSFNWEWSVPEPGGTIPEFSKTFEVSSSEPVVLGNVLLRYRVLRGFHNPEGFVCEEIPAVNPNQPTQLNNGWITDTAMTYPEAAAHLASMTATAVIDDSQTVQLSPHEIYSSTMLDWPSYVCSFTNAPLRLDLRVNYGDDWVESFYEAGHQIDISVTESDGVTPKATATVFTAPRNEWGGQPGYQTTDENWSGGSRPDIQPGNWVFATVDNGMTAQVQIGEITGVINFLDYYVSGTINAPWIDSDVQFECLDWGPSGGQFYYDDNYVRPDMSETYRCNWNPDEWQMQPWQNVGVGYFTPEGHWVATYFTASMWKAFWTSTPDPNVLTEGIHTYQFQWSYTSPEPLSGTSPERTVDVSSGISELYPGNVLLYAYGPYAFLGEGCGFISAIRPDQGIKYAVGWVNDWSMTYEEAQAHFGSFTIEAYLDGNPVESAKFTMTELTQFWGPEDRMAAVCSLTGGQ